VPDIRHGFSGSEEGANHVAHPADDLLPTLSKESTVEPKDLEAAIPAPLQDSLLERQETSKARSYGDQVDADMGDAGKDVVGLKDAIVISSTGESSDDYISIAWDVRAPKTIRRDLNEARNLLLLAVL
jgi:hypothetical protein